MKKFRLKSWIRNLSASDIPEYFDPDFYKEFNDDLPQEFEAHDLWNHYLKFGKREIRPGNSKQFLEPIEKEYGALPISFNASEYQALNIDIAQKIPNIWKATEHYLKYGKQEGRRYLRIDTDLYKHLNGFEDSIPDSEILLHYDNNIKTGAVKSGRDFMNQRQVKGGGLWLEGLNLLEFKLLNWKWIPKIENKVDAGNLVLNEGMARMAPLAFDLQFDPTYYAEAHPNLKGKSDTDLYRHWILEGLESGEAGNAKSRLKQIGLSLNAFPHDFDWRTYAHNQRLRGGDRWFVLEHFLHNLKMADPPPRIGSSDEANFLIAAAKSFSSRQDVYAIKLIKLADTFSKLSNGDRQIWADCLFRIQNWLLAIEKYELILSDSGGNIWTLINCVRAYLEMGSPELAALNLKQYGARYMGNNLYRSTVQEVVETIFKQEEIRSIGLYRQGFREEADENLLNAVKKCQELWDSLDHIGASTRLLSNKKIVVLANTDLRQCTHYRVEQKAEIFREMGIKFEIFSSANERDFLTALPGAAAAIFYRLPAFPRNVRAIEVAKRLGVPTYYEIDDLIFDNVYPDSLESYGGEINEEEYARLKLGVPLFREAMRRCDYGISSTSSLAAQMTPIIGAHKVFTVPNGLDSRNNGFVNGKIQKLRRDGDIVLFYGSGTKAHNEDFLEIVAPAIINLMSRNDQVRLFIVGFLALDSRFDLYKNRVKKISFVPDIQSYWSILREADINIAVLKSNVVTNGKSEIKWLEAAALAIPSIVSDTETYLDVIEDGVDGLIASTTEQWADHLDDLVANSKKRVRIAKLAKQKALLLYSLRANAKKMEEALSPAFEVLDESTRTLRTNVGPRRVLIANVFFPPQTIGGATRVVRDNLDDFLSLESGFDFGIASTDVAASEPYRLRIDQYKSTPVFRISTPEEVNMDWRPFNEISGAIFGRVLDLYSPHLVHFHAIQRLTASAVKECARRKIPYVVTVHDAWWISDHQFLIDDRGEQVNPMNAIDVRLPAGVSLGDSLNRRRELLSLLKGAKAVLGVSNSFSELYRACGVPTISIPNGIRHKHIEPSKKEMTERLCLAHVGGQSYHKGYHLIEAALRQGNFPNLELTVVDHRRTGGEAVRDLWGATTVKFVGMTPQESMSSFYEGQNVLLAPSIWPESFGLVTREALAAGLWVVASDRGAIGEDVETGKNGFVIDVSSPKSLFEVFHLLNASPEYYKKTPPSVKLRQASDQAAELLSLYKEILAESS